jgi:Pilus formation protein N terminal region
VSIAIRKSVVIDLPADVKDVLIANPETVQAIVKTKRRVYLIGTGLGQTNIYFFDADGREIGGLDLTVTSRPRSDAFENFALPAQYLYIFRGIAGASYSCTLSTCIAAEEGPNPNVTYTDITTHNRP